VTRVHALLLCVALAACTNATTGLQPAAGGMSSAATFGQEFTLKNGETASFSNDSLQVRFDKVTADDRCPVGATCVQEGDAVVVVTATRASATAQSFELHTKSGLAAEAAYGRYRIRLVKLEPRPVGEQPTPLASYTATLIVVTS
jgi:hypothetical protein